LQQFYLGFCTRCLSSTQAGSRFCTSLFVFFKGSWLLRALSLFLLYAYTLTLC